METLRVFTDAWSHQPVLRAKGFLQHWRGLRWHRPGSSMLLQRSSVHALGMRVPFRAIGLSARLEVAEARVVEPWRIVTFPGCAYVLELPIDVAPPPIGARLQVAHV